jgi:hypothetical protein
LKYEKNTDTRDRLSKVQGTIAAGGTGSVSSEYAGFTVDHGNAKDGRLCFVGHRDGDDQRDDLWSHILTLLSVLELE